MSDWQVGDLAVCVNAAPIKRPDGGQHLGNGLVQGAIYTVRGITTDQWGLLLCLENDPFDRRALRFRKIRPDEREACEPEFVTLLKRSRAPEKVE